jgi:WD40 repeat protein
LVASASWDMSIRIWNVEESRNIITIQENELVEPNCFLLLSNGHLASGELHAQINIWNVTTGFLVKSLSGHSNQVTFLGDLNSSKHLASGSHDGEIRIWDYQNGSCLKTIKAHYDAVYSIVMLKNFSLLSASLDGTLKTWTLANILSDPIIKVNYGKR